MAETIDIHVPRAGIGDELSAALAEHGLASELVDDGDICALQVSYATTEHDRLVTDVTHLIESWLAERGLPLVVQRANGGAVVRPPGD
ncbi:MAG TPA: hypothetical protein VGU02_09055 [Gaiellaceae bacterium]|nr:hypothetical protein [Gaiellaceae bacterium]